MKFVLSILKAFLINFIFIGIIQAETSCPAISPKVAGNSATEQVEAIINDVVCSFIDLKKQNIGILITDHNVRETLDITDRAYLLYEGKILKEGTAKDLISDENAKRLYLGNTFN